MAAPDIANTWGDIRQGVKDAETLIGQKQYNMAMIKATRTGKITQGDLKY